jgi:hypothetical protein
MNNEFKKRADLHQHLQRSLAERKWAVPEVRQVVKKEIRSGKDSWPIIGVILFFRSIRSIFCYIPTIAIHLATRLVHMKLVGVLFFAAAVAEPKYFSRIWLWPRRFGKFRIRSGSRSEPSSWTLDLKTHF